MKARAWVLSEPDRMEVTEFEVLPPAEDQVLVRMAVTSVCASDPKMVHGLTPFQVYPLILGHELSGSKATPVRFDDLVLKGVRIASDHAQAGQMEKAMEIINSGRYAIEKINNVPYRLEDLKKALEDTAHPPPGFIKGAVVFD